MKNPKRAAELIAELKSLAENQFESHRIEVLERDLQSPPVVEVIDDTHQKFDGVVYRKTCGGHYFYSMAIHRAVYSYYYGVIPKGFDIHHLDENKNNNSAYNLNLLTRSEHMKMHEKKRIKQICPICGKTFYSTKYKKTCSEMCWRKSKGVITKCKHCGKEFLKYLKEQEYCSISCGTAAMDASRNKINRICIQCGKEFRAISEGALYCSSKCANRYHYQHEREDRKCVICGKTFNVYKGLTTQTCSPSCGAKLSHIRRKSNAPVNVPEPPSADVLSG